MHALCACMCGCVHVWLFACLLAGGATLPPATAGPALHLQVVFTNQVTTRMVENEQSKLVPALGK